MSTTPTRRPEDTMLDALIAHHTDGAAAALAAHVTLSRARAEKQRLFNERGLPRTIGLSRPTTLPMGA